MAHIYGFHQNLSPPNSFSLSVFLLHPSSFPPRSSLSPSVWIIQHGRSFEQLPLFHDNTSPLHLCTRVSLRAASLSRPQMDRAFSGPCRLGTVNYRDVSRSYFHSNGGGLTRSWQTRSLIISWQSRKSGEALAHVPEYPQVRMLSSN